VLVDKLTVCRGRQDAAPDVGIDVDMVGHGLGFALQRKIAQVETLRHKRVVAHEQQISGGGIDDVGVIAQQQLALLRIERGQIDALRRSLSRGRCRESGCRQEENPQALLWV
jgi:hypothetical protein